jgi:trimethyllysine dioxygenase
MRLDGKFWEFTADLSKGDTAYTTMALGAHTDNTYFVWDTIFLVTSLIDCKHRPTLAVFNFSISYHIPKALEEQRFS